MTATKHLSTHIGVWLGVDRNPLIPGDVNVGSSCKHHYTIPKLAFRQPQTYLMPALHPPFAGPDFFDTGQGLLRIPDWTGLLPRVPPRPGEAAPGAPGLPRPPDLGCGGIHKKKYEIQIHTFPYLHTWLWVYILHVYMYMFVYKKHGNVYVYIYIYTYIHIRVHVSMYVCKHVPMYVRHCTSACMSTPPMFRCVYIYICMNLSLRICLFLVQACQYCTYTSIYTCVYTVVLKHVPLLCLGRATSNMRSQMSGASGFHLPALPSSDSGSRGPSPLVAARCSFQNVFATWARISFRHVQNRNQHMQTVLPKHMTTRGHGGVRARTAQFAVL